MDATSFAQSLSIARYDKIIELSSTDLLLISGGADRTCSGPTVCGGGVCEDRQGVCKLK